MGSVRLLETQEFFFLPKNDVLETNMQTFCVIKPLLVPFCHLFLIKNWEGAFTFFIWVKIFHSFWAEPIARWGIIGRSPWLVSRDPSYARTHSGEMMSDLERWRLAALTTTRAFNIRINMVGISTILHYGKNNTLIRLPGCAGWSASLLFAYGINRFCHDMAHFEPQHDKTKKLASAPSEDSESDQPGHPPSLIRVFAVCSMGR